MNRLCLSFAVLTILAVGSRAEAQDRPYYGGYVDDRASTYEESVMRGMSDAVRSAGEYNLSTSEAAINYEQARSMNFENRLQGTNTYFEMRQINSSYRAAERGPQTTQEDAIRNAADQAPDRMTKTDLDPLTGDIVWPIVLQTDLFADLRNQLDTRYRDRAMSSGAIGADSFFEIQQLTEQMLALLKENVANFPPQGYTEAKSFLEALSYESRFPTG